MTGQAIRRQSDMFDRAGSATLGGLLDRVRIELDTLTDIVGDMQVGLSPLLLDAATRHPETYRYAQNLDLIWQTLESLARVMVGVSHGGASGAAIDVDALVADLTLADLATRLRGLVGQNHDDDLDLF